MGFEAIPQDIRDAAKKLGAAASGVKGADPSGDVDGIKTALPSSKSSAAAATLATAWKTRFKTWTDDAVSLQQRCEAGAASYDESDHKAALRSKRTASSPRIPSGPH